MKTILVPTDFSEAARNASEYAVNLAKETNAKVILFHAYHVPITSPEDSIMVITPEELQKENEKNLEIEASYLKKQTGVDIQCVTKIGFAVDEILEEEKKASLIVMGMRGASKLSEILLGSITVATMRKSKTPILIVPENAKFKTPKKIVFACDYDPRTDLHAIEELKDFVKDFHSKLYVVNVKQKKELVSIDKSVMQLENNLSDIEHIYSFSENEDLVDGINEFVDEKQADMIAIIPHHYGLLEGLFHKSISKKMAFHTHVPLLTLPDGHKSIPAYFL